VVGQREARHAAPAFAGATVKRAGPAVKRTRGGPPPLDISRGRLRRQEVARAELYILLRQALENADGVVSHAGQMIWQELDPEAARNKANCYVRRLGLKEYAAGLREAATGHAMGRQDR
jgi:hypothetical protein